MATTIGNGVVDYNTANAEAKKKIAANQLKINNDPNYVASEQQRALQVIAQRQAQGLDTSAQNKYLTKNLGYKAPTATTAAVQTPTTPTAAPVTSAARTTNAQQGSDYMAQMAAIANRQVTPFSYDPNGDPAYQAALTRAKANIDTGNSQVQAENNRRGILNSTITTDRGSEIAAQEMGNVETTVLPQLMQQAYQKYMDQENMKQQQFANLGSLSSQYFNEDQRAIDNTNTTAGLTGNLPGGEQAQSLVNQLLSLKQQAETKGITAADRSKLSNQADGIRAMLSQMGVDASQYSSGVNYNTASQITPNIRTLAGKQLDQQATQQQWDNRFNYGQAIGQFANGQQTLDAKNLAFNQQQQTEQFAYQKARDAISDKQWQTKFDEDVRQNGLSYGLQQLSRMDDQAYRQAQLALSQDDNDRAWAQFDASTSKTADAKIYEDYQSNIEKLAVRDGDTGKLKNPDAVKTYISNSDMSNYEKYRAWVSSGLEWPSNVEVPTPGE